ncbi:class I SAM-dependent methyltransferase [Streptomyces nondiastaticus]|uniref:SAM-dependent methyltransferase n=1 Tax=Streptomyces nondiastaticus TaxID=3154512 RepID=UPI003438BC85
MDVLSLVKSVRDRVGEPLGDALAAVRIAGNWRMPLLLAVSKGFVTPVYRAAFLASAAGSGVLGCLAVRPCDLESLADKLGAAQDKQRLRAWLELGVRLGELDRREGCYRLKSIPARTLARAGNDALAAALEEVLRFHVPVLLGGPRMAATGERFSLGDQDGLVIARSTRVIEPLVEAAIARTLDRDNPVRLLEVGCGSGVHVRHAARLNPRLSALAIDMQEEVAETATKNMAEWGLADRVETRRGDLRTLDLEPQFDLVTMHNNIYYFAEDERVAALEKARSLLAPGGRILLTTSCQGGNIGLDVLSLWFTYADFGGPLPREEELVAQLERAGFTGVEAARLVPGEQFRAFTATSK